MTDQARPRPVRVFSASELDRRAGINPVERRTLVNVGLLAPMRTGGGWAVFTADDIARAKAWKLSRRAETRA